MVTIYPLWGSTPLLLWSPRWLFPSQHPPLSATSEGFILTMNVKKMISTAKWGSQSWGRWRRLPENTQETCDWGRELNPDHEFQLGAQSKLGGWQITSSSGALKFKFGGFYNVLLFLNLFCLVTTFHYTHTSALWRLLMLLLFYSGVKNQHNWTSNRIYPSQFGLLSYQHHPLPSAQC